MKPDHDQHIRQAMQDIQMKQLSLREQQELRELKVAIAFLLIEKNADPVVALLAMINVMASILAQRIPAAESRQRTIWCSEMLPYYVQAYTEGEKKIHD